jgi:glycosyltransferase involved in cell wall biosynthesis
VERLRVAVVSDAIYPWHKGGKEVRYLHLVTALPESEIDVVVYTMKWWDAAPEVVRTESGSLTYVAICPRIEMYKDKRRSITQALFFAASTFRLLTRKFDVIEADHMPYLQLLPLRFVAWIKRVPLIVTWHEVWGRDGWTSYIGRLGPAAAIVERLSFRLPDKIVAVSKGTGEKLIAMGAERDHVVVVPTALDLDQLRLVTPDASAPELLFVGRLIEHKHADLAVQAVRILTGRGLDVHLGIVGVGPEEHRLRTQVKDLNLSDRVTFFSLLDSQLELWSLIRGSRVLLAPSIREGFGLAVAESLALGTPVVCAVHPENESSNLVSPDTGSLVTALDAQALSDAAEYWLKSNSIRGDRVSTFLAQHAELTVGGMSAAYAAIFRKSTR